MLAVRQARCRMCLRAFQAAVQLGPSLAAPSRNHPLASGAPMASLVCHPRGSPALPRPGGMGQGACRHSTWQRGSSLANPGAPTSTGRGSGCRLRHWSSTVAVRACKEVPSEPVHGQHRQQHQQTVQQSVRHHQEHQQNAPHHVALPQLTRRQLASAALSLTALSLPAALPLPGQLAHAAEIGGKTRKLPLNELKDIIARDISDGQYFVTGQLTRSIYREDCKFKDPTNTTVGVGKYLAAIGILFDPEYSKHELLTIQETTANGAPAIEATWKLGGYLKFPWRPRVVPFTGSTTYVFDNDGLVALHEETWGISPAAALIETFTPTFGPRQLL